jgi:hypothetical protein
MRPLKSDLWKRFAERCRTEADGWQVCCALTLYEAEQLLDCLEANGVSEREMSLGKDGVSVRWRAGRSS